MDVIASIMEMYNRLCAVENRKRSFHALWYILYQVSGGPSSTSPGPGCNNAPSRKENLKTQPCNMIRDEAHNAQNYIQFVLLVASISLRCVVRHPSRCIDYIFLVISAAKRTGGAPNYVRLVYFAIRVFVWSMLKRSSLRKSSRELHCGFCSVPVGSRSCLTLRIPTFGIGRLSS